MYIHITIALHEHRKFNFVSRAHSFYYTYFLCVSVQASNNVVYVQELECTSHRRTRLHMLPSSQTKLSQTILFSHFKLFCLLACWWCGEDALGEIVSIGELFIMFFY